MPEHTPLIVTAWVLRYRSKHGGQPRFKFGDARRMDLRSARAEAWRLKDEIAKGNEPGVAKREAKQAEVAQPIRTVNDLFDAYEKAGESGEWKPKKKRKRPQTIAYEKAIANRHIRPALGAHRLDDVKRPLVKGVLRAMIEKGIGAQTNRTHALMRQAFNFAMSEDLMTSNPAMMVESGRTLVDAAQMAELKEESLRKALAKPHVKAFVASLRREWLAGETLQSWHTVSELRKQSQSDKVRLDAAKTVIGAAGELASEANQAPRNDGQTRPADAGTPPKTATQTIGLIALGLGRFRVMSEHEHRLEWEREYRSHP